MALVDTASRRQDLSGAFPPPPTAPQGRSYRRCCVSSLAELAILRREGPLAQWEALMADDPAVTFFQGPVWCTEWYRSYGDLFEPLLMYVTLGETLVGIAPLAVERSTRRLTFAGDEMLDYRDVIAAPDHRGIVIEELLRLYRTGGYPGPLRIGPTQPDSATVGTVLSLAGPASGLHAIPRSHPGWRLWLDDPEALKRATGKKVVRNGLNYYQRQGPVSLERIATEQEWRSVREEFFDRHSLRQLQAGRPMSFHQPRKRAFCDALLREDPSAIHVTVLRVGGRFVAGHYGYTWRNVLFWGAPVHDIREEKRSPGQIHMALLLEQEAARRLRGIDWTIGTEEYKKWFSNSRCDLPSVEIYSRGGEYFARKGRDGLVGLTRTVVIRTAGRPRWDELVRSWFRGVERARRARRTGWGAGLAKLALKLLVALGEQTRGMVFVATPGDVQPAAPVLAPGESCTFREDELRDLLKWHGAAQETADALAAAVQAAPERLRRGHTLHTLTVSDRLAVWGWSYRPQEPALLTESGTSFSFEPNSVSLYDFHTVPEYRRRRLYQALLSHILSRRFAEGAERAYIACVAANQASRRAIERTGFRLAVTNDCWRLLGFRRVITRSWG